MCLCSISVARSALRFLLPALIFDPRYNTIKPFLFTTIVVDPPIPPLYRTNPKVLVPTDGFPGMKGLTAQLCSSLLLSATTQLHTTSSSSTALERHAYLLHLLWSCDFCCAPRTEHVTYLACDKTAPLRPSTCEIGT